MDTSFRKTFTDPVVRSYFGAVVGVVIGTVLQDLLTPALPRGILPLPLGILVGLLAYRGLHRHRPDDPPPG